MKFDSIADIHGSPGYLLRRGGQLVTSVFDRTVGHAGITAGQITVLLAVHIRPGLQQREMAAVLNWDEATMGGMIKRLEAGGYIVRQSSTRSSRGRQIYMTPEGEAFFRKIKPAVLRVQKKLLRGLTREEGQQLLYLLSKLVKIDDPDYSAELAPGPKKQPGKARPTDRSGAGRIAQE